MDFTERMLRELGLVDPEAPHYCSPRAGHRVFRTHAGQWIGAYVALVSFRNARHQPWSDWYVQRSKANPAGTADRTWEAHHIVERKDLAYLRERTHGAFPADDDLCPCVLLPRMAHGQRLDRLSRGRVVLHDDIETYREAYAEFFANNASYTGAAPERLVSELMSIVTYVFDAR